MDKPTKFIEVTGQEARMSIKLGNWRVGYANIHDVWKILKKETMPNIILYRFFTGAIP
jgi:hypothetical protein